MASPMAARRAKHRRTESPMAERELMLRRPDGTEEQMRVLLWKPVFRGSKWGWEADVEVHSGSHVTHSHGDGIDAFQALYGALHQITAIMDATEEDGRITMPNDDWHWLPAVHLGKPADRT